MDEPQRDQSQRDLHVAAPSLKAAIRVARIENAERSEVVAELRGAEMARLEMLLEALEPVLAQVPKDIDLFDAAIAPGDHPRLFIDMIGFVEMGRDRRLYRFLQDTRHGRVTIAETEKLDKIVDAVTAYIARRLIEREKSLATDRPAASFTAAADAVAKPSTATPRAAAPPRRGFLRRVLHVVVDIFGAIVLFLLVAALGFFAYEALVGANLLGGTRF
ncbi:MAG TPA: hypothetical protein VG271_10595 [Beijerinckiaceae bacterium]|nr:hypothetical protein [Beijerinckiaceae bacterium]